MQCDGNGGTVEVPLLEKTPCKENGAYGELTMIFLYTFVVASGWTRRNS